MGKHSRTSPLSVSQPYAPQRNAGYLESLPASEPQRLRQDAFENHFGQGHTKVVSFGEGDAPLDPGSPRAVADRSSMAHTLSKTTVPPTHLNGVQFMRVLPGMIDEQRMAQYHPQHQGMDVPTMRHSDPVMRSQQVRSLVHEVGHHAEQMTNGRISSLGRSEAMAENYADRHLPLAPMSHGGVTVGFRPQSGYDTLVPHLDTWQQSWDPTGEQNRARYAKTRAKGTMPNEY
jgi:hypothetical protein